MEHEIDGMEVRWICGICETQMADLFNWTAVPMCEQCGSTFYWSDILEQAEINTLLAELMPDRYGNLLLESQEPNQ